MSEINSIANGTFTIGQTSATNFQAGPGIKIDEPSAGTVRIGNDETVLWSGNYITSSKATFATNESPMNFEKLSIWGRAFSTHCEQEVAEVNPNDVTANDGFSVLMPYKGGGTIIRFSVAHCYLASSGLSIQDGGSIMISLQGASVVTGKPVSTFTKIVGINRISGSNA